MEKVQKVQTISAIILIGFVLGVIFHYVLGSYLHMDTPFDSFLYPAKDAFCDFYMIFPFLKDFRPYNQASLWVVYFPLAYILFLPFIFIKNMLLSFLVLISIFLSSFAYLNTRFFTCEKLTKPENFQNIFIFTLMSYPLLYLLDRGNFDMILLLILGAFVILFQKEKYLISAVLLAVANAIKPFSILFLLLFLKKKKYKETFLSLVLTSLLVIGGFMFFKGGFFHQIEYFIKTMALFKYTYGLLYNQNGMGYASSLYIVLKLIFCKSTMAPLVTTATLLKFYGYFSLAATAITCFFVYRENSFWKQLTLLVCNFLLLPIVTFDYKLIFLYLPIWFFVNAKEKAQFDWLYTILFALLLIPKNIVFTPDIAGPTGVKAFSLSIIINPVLMILLTGLIIYEQINKKTQKEE